jgi:hypothetical protein
MAGQPPPCLINPQPQQYFSLAHYKNYIDVNIGSYISFFLGIELVWIIALLNISNMRLFVSSSTPSVFFLISLRDYLILELHSSAHHHHKEKEPNTKAFRAID